MSELKNVGNLGRIVMDSNLKSLVVKIWQFTWKRFWKVSKMIQKRFSLKGKLSSLKQSTRISYSFINTAQIEFYTVTMAMKTFSSAQVSFHFHFLICCGHFYVSTLSLLSFSTNQPFKIYGRISNWASFLEGIVKCNKKYLDFKIYLRKHKSQCSLLVRDKGSIFVRINWILWLVRN